jgi:hypothetical protein
MNIKMTLLLCGFSVFLASGCTKNPSSTSESQIKAPEAEAQLAPKAKEAAPSPQAILEQAYAKLSDDSNISSEEIHTENFGKPPPSEAAPALARQVDATSTFTYRPNGTPAEVEGQQVACTSIANSIANQSSEMYRAMNDSDSIEKGYETLKELASSGRQSVSERTNTYKEMESIRNRKVMLDQTIRQMKLILLETQNNYSAACGR